MAKLSLPEWAQCLFDESYRYIAIHGGRGSSKSRSVASALVIRASQKPLRILCTREIQNSIKASVKQLLEDEIERLGLQSLFKSTEYEIKCANGSQFLFAGLRHNIDSIKSMEGIDICWIEEAQTISQGSLNVLIPTIRKSGSQLVFTWNPKSKEDPVDAMFRGETRPPRTYLREVNYSDNPFFPDELRQEMEYDQKRDPDKHAHVWLGKYWLSSESRVFNNWKVEEFEVDRTAIIRQGADWGFSVDPTVLVQCYIVGRTLYVPYEAYRVGCEIVDTPALFMSVPDAEKWPMVADSARPETISHMQRNGFPKISPAIKGARSVEEGVEWLKSYDIIVHPRCKHLIDELAMYSYKTDPITGAVLPVLEDKDNHVIDALRYACESARRLDKVKPPPPVKVIPTVHHFRR